MLKEEAFRQNIAEIANRIRRSEVTTTKPVKELMQAAQDLGILGENKGLENRFLDLISEIQREDKVNYERVASRVEKLADYVD